jgi:hypothetical protein
VRNSGLTARGAYARKAYISILKTYVFRGILGRREALGMTLTELRKNVYTVFDEVLRTGRTIEIHSRGRTVLLSPGGGGSKLGRLRKAVRRRALAGNPESIIHMNWDAEWHPRHI